MTKKRILLGLFLILLTVTHAMLAAPHSTNFPTLTQAISPVESSASNHGEAEFEGRACCRHEDKDKDKQ